MRKLTFGKLVRWLGPSFQLSRGGGGGGIFPDLLRKRLGIGTRVAGMNIVGVVR